jgi:hypothetical protein
VSLRQRVGIEHDLLRGVHRLTPACVDRVLPSLFPLGVVPVIVELVRDRLVGLLDAAPDLLEQRLLECLRVRHDGVGVGVLGFEVGDDLGVLPFTQPEVVVDPHVAMGDELLRSHLRRRRRGLGL